MLVVVSLELTNGSGDGRATCYLGDKMGRKRFHGDGGKTAKEIVADNFSVGENDLNFTV